MNNKQGQIFVNLVIWVLAFIIFIFAAPFISQIIFESLPGVGTAVAFFMKLFLWVIAITMVALFLKIIASGEGFFT